MKITVEGFTGIMPRYGAKTLPNNAAQVAENVRLESGEIRPITVSAPIAGAVLSNALSIYPIGIGSYTYLSWASDVDVARSPIADSEGRIYYTGDGVPKKTLISLATAGPGPYPNATTGWYHLGVPTPTATLTATGTGTGTVTETRVYVYTFVNAFGSVLEESAPSKPVTVTLTNNTAASISNILDLTPTTNYNPSKKRLYRSVGAGAFTLVAEIPLGTTTFVDNLTLIPGDLLPSATWAPPPADLKGLCQLPGGVLCGFRNNEIWFSEPYFPHAWPPKYMQTVNSSVVAIRPFGNNLAVATENYPEVGSGYSPDTFTFQLVPLRAPCVSKRSMAGDEDGVLFASNEGLISLGLNGSGIATQQIATRYEFAGYAPSTILGCTFDRKYFGFYTTNNQIKSFVFRSGDNPPFSTLSIAATAAVIEPVTNRLVVLDSVTGKLAYVDPLDTLPMTFSWRSKVFELPYALNMAAGLITSPDLDNTQQAYLEQVTASNQLIATQNAATFATGRLGSTFNGGILNSVTVGGSTLKTPVPLPDRNISVYVYAAGNLVYTASVTPQVPFRLPAGFTARSWEVAVSGQQAVQRIEIATSMAELSQ